MSNSAEFESGERGEVALFVSCLVDLMRPEAAFAAWRLLEDAGYLVVIPEEQTCCGQPGYNSGDYVGAAELARRTIEQLAPYPYVVIPSGSCAGMLRQHYPKLLEGHWQQRAQELAGRVFELSEFLVDIAEYSPRRVEMDQPVTYHDACAGLRELGIREQPRQLLAAAGIQVRELSQRDVCCGFGGTFCAKMPALSARMADEKLHDIEATGATEVVAGDIGCLMALAGRARRLDKNLQFRHVAEILAGDLIGPGIGAKEDPSRGHNR